MKTRFRFEKLEVWQEARKSSGSIRRLTQKFTSHEMSGMTSQLRRAAVSIPSSIAEGSGRNSDRDFAHFLEQAHGSLMEVVSFLHLAMDESHLTQAQLDPLLNELEMPAKRITALNRSLAVKTSKIPFMRRNGNTLDPRPPTPD